MEDRNINLIKRYRLCDLVLDVGLALGLVLYCNIWIPSVGAACLSLDLLSCNVLLSLAYNVCGGEGLKAGRWLGAATLSVCEWTYPTNAEILISFTDGNRTMSLLRYSCPRHAHSFFDLLPTKYF